MAGTRRSSRSPRVALRRALTWLGRVTVALVALSVVQVLWVRWLPPLTTQTILARRWEAWRAGRPSSIERDWVGRREISDEVVRAVLAGEDTLFYQHHGFDWRAIRVAWRHNQHSRRVEGASTLTQQTAKNLFLWQQRSWLRKGLEAWYTVLLELLVPKERILVLYLNVAEWGDRVFGVEAGARRWLGKSARHLTRDEAALLVSCLPNPRRYPPTGGSRFIARRRAAVLRRMHEVAPAEPARVAPDDGDDEEGR